MKNLFKITIVFIFVSLFSNAQQISCDCKTDLDFMVEKMKKMPSYKKQIVGEKKTEFENTYQEISSKMKSPIGIEACYQLLLKQMTLINDGHVGLSVNTKFYNAEKNVNLFNNSLTDETKISDLQSSLKNKPETSPEGIYTFKNEIIGITYLNNDSKTLVGYVLESDLLNWKKGDVRFYLYPTSGKKYNMYYYNTDTKTPGFVTSLTLENGRIWSYKKEGNTNNFELSSEKVDVATFKQINDNVQYLYFKTFGNHKKKELKAFIADTKNKITADNVIVDLRNNSGGNSKFSDPFVKVLKNKNVYVITNCFAGSNGEQFTLELLKNKKAKHLGQATRGVIAYGKNYGYDYDTPSGHFKFTPTDMNFHEFIDYEGKGVEPEIKLDFDRDWIEQTLEVIEADKNKA
ncbi:S41 family peptidase [Winogradskyella litorisediminis]|uniref:S41 family peptidase n=1 Tax=Winogradskyella litorisediminis TaxID=1156618 RepID=A0ABW3N5G9_9FLAO